MNIDNESPFQSLNRSKGVLILDWDDTFLPTTFIMDNKLLLEGMKLVPPDGDTKIMIDTCCVKIIELFEMILKLDLHAYIVTNALSMWVFMSAEHFYPDLFKSEVFWKIPVVSARDRYSVLHPISMSRWKNLAIRDIVVDHSINKINGNIDNIQNIISIGDSNYERNAVLSLRTETIYVNSVLLELMGKPCPNIDITTLDLTNTLIKTIKLPDEPNQLDQFNAQLQYLIDNLASIVQEPIDIDILITINNNIAPELEPEPEPEPEPESEYDFGQPMDIMKELESIQTDTFIQFEFDDTSIQG